MKIPFSLPVIDDEVIAEMHDTLTHTGWLTTGPKARALEDEIRQFTGGEAVLCVNSWTSGAMLMLRWLGVGPGDEVIIDIWGASQNTIRQQISPDGTINIQKIGPVNLNGLTIAEANDYLKKTLNKIYNGLNNANDPTSDIRLTLGSIRTIQINVMGEVVQPGTYSLSSFATVFHALYLSLIHI